MVSRSGPRSSLDQRSDVRDRRHFAHIALLDPSSQAISDDVLMYLRDVFSSRGFPLLNLSNDTERAVLYVLAMGGVMSAEQAELLSTTFHSLNASYQLELLRNAGQHSHQADTAVLSEQMPNLISEALQATHVARPEERERAISSVLNRTTSLPRSRQPLSLERATSNDTDNSSNLAERDPLGTGSTLGSDIVSIANGTVSHTEIPPLSSLVRVRQRRKEITKCCPSVKAL